MRLSAKFRKMMPIYRLFGGDHASHDYSETAAIAQFAFESAGVGLVGVDNGYAIGKHWMDVTLAGWIEEIMACRLFMSELYDDPQFAEFHWWLDKVVKYPIAKKISRGERYDLWFMGVARCRK